MTVGQLLAQDGVAGLGMNEMELAKNPHLTDFVIHDLNREPELPFDDSSFDAVVNAVSIQYLTRPVEVFRSCARVLRPGGLHAVALSHRCFPTKAIRAWHILPPRERLDAVEATARSSEAGRSGRASIARTKCCFSQKATPGPLERTWSFSSRRAHAESFGG